MEDTPRKYKKKAGRVVRLTPDLVKVLADEQREGETIPATIRRLLKVKGEILYVLPSDVYERVEDARGQAVLRAIRAKTKRTEKPIQVQKV